MEKFNKSYTFDNEKYLDKLKFSNKSIILEEDSF